MKKTWVGFGLLLGASVLAGASSSQAQPAVTSADGFVHGQSATISGSAFGQKDPAAPALWIDSEAHAPGAAASTADGWSSIGGAGWTYSDRLADVDQAHGRSSRYLSGYHDPDCGGQACNNIEIGYHPSAPAARWFVFYYLRLHPDWGAPPAGYCDDKGGIDRNYKEMWQHESCAALSGPTVTSYYGGDESFSDVEPWHFGSSSPDICGAQINDEPLGGNPSQRWSHRMWVVGLDPGYLRVANLSSYAGDRHAVIERSCSQPLFETHDADRNEICHVDFGAYARYCADNSTFTNMRRYIDDVYIDTTWARVLLGDAATVDECTVLEPQSPSSWTDGSIAVTANLGRLGGSSAYLFVYDADGNVNSPGFAVTIDGELPDAGADAAVGDDAGAGGNAAAGGGGPNGGAGGASMTDDGGGDGCGCRAPSSRPGQGSVAGLFMLLLLGLNTRRRSAPSRSQCAERMHP